MNNNHQRPFVPFIHILWLVIMYFNLSFRFLHLAPIPIESWLTPRWWHFKAPKHVGKYRVSIHWRITAFVGFFIHPKKMDGPKCEKKTAKKPYVEFFSTSNWQYYLHSKENPIIRSFCISGRLVVPINPDKWSSTVNINLKHNGMSKLRTAYSLPTQGTRLQSSRVC
jgi:hypothetical protein